MAKSIEISEDRLTYTFTLRKGVKWSDGSPLTARDFERSYKTLASKSTHSSYRWYLRVAHIRGAEAALNGHPEKLGVHAKNNQLIIHLSQPVPWLLNLLTFPSFLPVHLSNLEESVRFNKNDSDRLISNGPYRIKEITPVGYRLEVNPHYHMADRLDITEVHYRIVPGIDQEVALFEQEKLDITSHLPSTLANGLRKKHPVSVFENRYLATYFFLVSPTSEIMKNRPLRNAISLAINRNALITSQFNDTLTRAACSFTPPTAHGYSPDRANCKKLLNNPNRVELALNQLQASGITKQDPNLALSILATPKHLSTTVLPMIAQQIEDTLGIKVRIETKPWAEFMTTQDRDKFDLIWLGWAMFHKMVGRSIFSLDVV